MGNHTSKPSGAVQKMKQFASPLSPMKRRKNTNATAIPAPKFDWLDCYNTTQENPTPQALPSEYNFKDFQLHHEKELGEGAFAKVVLATHVPSSQQVAVKIITKSAIPDEMKEYVAAEPGALAQLKHKNIVSLLLVHEDTHYIYMFLQFMAGGDLHSRLERDGAVQENTAKAWFKQMVDALDYTHKNNMCHRDLKLENLLIAGEGKKAKILMIDYGFVGYMPTEDHLFSDFPGSFCYAAPELIKGTPYKGRNADVYSLGVILYTLLQGCYPFYDEDRPTMTKMIMRDNVTYDTYISAPARELVRWMLSKNPADRPSMEQIKNHAWIKPADNAAMKAIKNPMSPMSPLKTTVQRIKATARASLSPVPSRRRRTSVL